MIQPSAEWKNGLMWGAVSAFIGCILYDILKTLFPEDVMPVAVAVVLMIFVVFAIVGILVPAAVEMWRDMLRKGPR